MISDFDFVGFVPAMAPSQPMSGQLGGEEAYYCFVPRALWLSSCGADCSAIVAVSGGRIEINLTNCDVDPCALDYRMDLAFIIIEAKA